MIAGARPLAGCSVNVSISEAEDTAERGIASWQINRVTLRIVSALFGQGARLVFGHDWRADGVMQAVHGFALAVHAPMASEERANFRRQPLLVNLLPWPDEPQLDELDRERLAATLLIEPAGLPAELLSTFSTTTAFPQIAPGVDGATYRYLRSRGLSHLRHRLNDFSDARLCLGGRRTGFAGRYPGIVEEALYSVRADKPLYVTAILGGASQDLVHAFERDRMPESFSASPQCDLYAEPPIRERDPSTQPDRTIDLQQVWDDFGKYGVDGLARANGLSVSQNRELFEASTLDRVIQLVLSGLASLRFER